MVLNNYFFKDNNNIYYGYDPGKPIDEDLIKIDNVDYNSFVLNIDNNDTNTLEFSLYGGDGDMLEQDRIFRITVSTNKFVIHEVYNQFKYYK